MGGALAGGRSPCGWAEPLHATGSAIRTAPTTVAARVAQVRRAHDHVVGMSHGYLGRSVALDTEPLACGALYPPFREGATEACLAVSGWRGRRLGHSKHPIRVVYCCHLLSLLNYTC